MSRVFLLLICGFSVLSAGCAGDKGADAAKKLQGVWQVTKHISTGGEPASDDEIKEFTFEFKENKLVRRRDKEADGKEYQLFTIDQTKSPMWFDQAYPVPGGEKALGIFRFTEDGLEICMAAVYEEEPTFRPSEFKASKKSILFVLKKKQ